MACSEFALNQSQYELQLNINRFSMTTVNTCLHILLVDDDEDEYILIKNLLADRSYLSKDSQQIGFRLDWVPTYETALEAFQKDQHDVYLVDYHLGSKNGLELMQKAIHNGCKAPIIMLTGQGSYQVDMAAMQAGAADYLVKGQIDSQLLERSIRYAVERTHLINILNERATRDELTGLYNRREFNFRLDEEISRYNRFGHSVGLIALDIDNFKNINDAHGHLLGDEILRRVAKLLIATVRSVDQPARMGGDEFFIILPETTIEQALEVAERLRNLVIAQPFHIMQDSGRYYKIPIHISLGIACLPEDATTKEDLIEAADRALYAAKKSGRNCVVQYKTIQNQANRNGS
jgi:diguanylate cyclase (GGDEF)-like protein